MRHLLVAAVLIAFAAGCIEPSFVPCGDLGCPNGTICVADTLCATSDQVAACASVAEGGACSVGGSVGQCSHGACLPAGCGNGIIDPGEVCDDGNTTSGDGCRGDCMKLESCGDGVVDHGEACDDGNANPADGCDDCRATTWSASIVIGGGADPLSVGLNSPTTIAADHHGAIYFCDNSNRVQRIDASGAISVFAGNGSPGFSGDGGPATSAQLWGPIGLAIDGLGNVFISDSYNQVIRRVDTGGTITTVAGMPGVGNYNGDNISARSAALYYPAGIAVDGLGNLLIADYYNERIRRVDTAGVITTIAGDGSFSFGGDGGPAVSAQLNLPAIVAVDAAGEVFVGDSYNYRIRKIDRAGTITTVVGNGTNGFLGDGGPATAAEISLATFQVDSAGNLFVFDETNARIREVDGTGTIRTIAGTGTPGYAGDGGPATSAEIHGGDLAIDDGGTIYLSDYVSNRIRTIDLGGTIRTIAGDGTTGTVSDGAAATSVVVAPYGVAIDAHDVLYIADADQRIRTVDTHGLIRTIAGTGVSGFSGDGGPATAAMLSTPQDVAVDDVGNVYIADTGNQRVRRIDPSGIITTIAGTGNSGTTGDEGPAVDAELISPVGLAIDHAGNLYVSDDVAHRVRRIDSSGVIHAFAGNGTEATSGDGGPAVDAAIGEVEALAVDAAGDVFLADIEQFRVRKVDATGTITTFAGTGTSGLVGDGGPATSAELRFPSGVAASPAGDVFIAEQSYRIRRVDSTGTASTYAGITGLFGFRGDGGPAVAALFTLPGRMRLDTHGNLFVADRSGGLVRRIDPQGVITTVAGAIDPIGMGAIAHARLADPGELVVAAPFTLITGGSSGTIQAIANGAVAAVAGRYPHAVATGSLARFRASSFGAIGGLAFDGTSIYLTEGNRVWSIALVDPAVPATWTIAPLANLAGNPGYADGAAADSTLRAPTGLHLDGTTLYVADTGNHLIRAIDLATGQTTTVAGQPAMLGFAGDGGPASRALLYEPRGITTCPNGDVFVADTGNQRIRRIAGGTITTVLGVGVAGAAGEGRPASAFPVDTPRDLACDPIGNLFVTSGAVIRILPSDATGTVDGSGAVATIYGAPPRDHYPESVTTCLAGLVAVDATTVRATDSCRGMLLEITRQRNSRSTVR